MCMCLVTKLYVLDHNFGVIKYVFCCQVVLQFKLSYYTIQYTYLYNADKWRFMFIACDHLFYYEANNIIKVAIYCALQ